MPSLQELLPHYRAQLIDVPSDDVARDIRILAAHALGVDRSRMSLHMHDILEIKAQAHLDAMIAARALCTPISKIIQKRMFWGRDFTVTEDVLDPRGDTETLIDASLKLGPCAKVLDLGTGSGAIAITLAAEWPNASVVATDVSDQALKIAKLNADRIGTLDRMQFLNSNWFETVQGSFNLIVSNPPYIARDEMPSLSKEVRDFDPRMALTDEADGLSAYRQILSSACHHLFPGGHLIVEIGHAQGRAVSEIFAKAGFSSIQVIKDFENHDRVVMGQVAVEQR